MKSQSGILSSIHRAAVAVILIAVSTASGAENARQTPASGVRWGEVSPGELRDTLFPGDPDAAAVILYEKGYVTFDESFNLVYKFHRRVKILNSGGYRFGTVVIGFDDDVQQVDDLEGHTMTPDAGGGVVRTKLEGDDIFEEDVTGPYKRIKFTMPSLQPGCVIEYRYEKVSTNPHYFPEWYFQDSEPTVWSELEVEIPGVFGYAFVSTAGYHRFSVETSGHQKKTFRTAFGNQVVDVARSHWVMENAPAIRGEEYVTTTRDYMANVTFQLAEVRWPGEMPVKVLQSWEKLAEELIDHKRFGGMMDGSGEIERLAGTLTSGVQDTLERMRAIHRYLTSSIAWDGRYSILCDLDQDEVLTQGKGGSAEINLLFVALARAAGVRADPVLISTRGHGKIQRLYPMIDQFNTVLCAAMIGGTWVFMDATDRMRPFDLLPVDALNHTGFLLREKSPAWVSIEPPQKSEVESWATMNLGEDGTIYGELRMNFRGYAGYNARRSLGGMKEAEFVKSYFETAQSGFTADSIVVENVDSVDLPLKVRATISLGAHVQVLDSFLYLTPGLSRIVDNPFTSEQRTYPIDYGYGISRTTIVNYIIPESYTVVESPPDVGVALAKNGGSFRREMKYTEPVFQYQEKFIVRTIVFDPRDYPTLRSMYEKLSTAGTEVVVLKRTRGHIGQ